MRNPIFDSSLRNVSKFFFTFISQELFSVRLEKAVNNGKIMLSSSIFRGTLLLFMTPHRYIPENFLSGLLMCIQNIIFSKQRVYFKSVPETIFFRLVQYFAIVLFE